MRCAIAINRIDKAFSYLSDCFQGKRGVVMDIRKLSLTELGRDTPEEYRLRPKVKLFFVADHIRSGHNIGALFRIADAFCFSGVHLCGYHFDPSNPEVHKTALSAQHSVPWQHWPNTPACLDWLKSQGVELIGIEQTNRSIALQEMPVDKAKSYALVLGNEVRGISDEVLMLMDSFAVIPQFGTKHSINVSVVAGIAGWEFIRKMNLP